jgi:DNA-binding XRE family transcriptional regulator
MYITDLSKAPKPQETLANYIKRLREEARLSQRELAEAAGLHLQSLGKLERGKTSRLNQKTKQGLELALNIPQEYLDAVCQGRAIEEIQKKQFCPNCWKGGAQPEPMWMLKRAKYCLLCGTQLLHSCRSCHEPISLFKHRFCPVCGIPYINPQINP